MRFIKPVIITLFIISHFILSPTFAHETSSYTVENNPWKGSKTELGGNINTGNTQDSNLIAASKLVYTHNAYQNTFSSEFRHGTKNNKKNKQIFTIGDEVTYYQTERVSWYGNIEAIVDQFSPYKYTISETVGLGYLLHNRPTRQIKLQLGPGLRQTKTRADNRSVLNGIFGASLKLHLHLNEKTRFNQKISAHIPFTGIEQYDIYKSKTSISMKVSDKCKAELSYNVLHYSDIPRDSNNNHRTNTHTALSIVYKV